MLVFFGLATLLTDFLLTKEQKSWNALTAMLGVALSGASLWVLVRPAAGYVTAFSNSITVDPFFIFFGCVFLAATAFAILTSVRCLEIEKAQSAEFYALILFAAMGMMFLAAANDLVVLFAGLETMGVSFYILTGYFRSERRSNEAVVKALVTGALSSAILAYGFSILYGIAGSTNLQAIERAIQQRHADFPGTDLLTFLALGTITAGSFFKIAAVPFHAWAPDTYEGSPTPIAAFTSVGSQVAGFALLLRIYLTVFWPVNVVSWANLMAVAGVLSLVLGTFAALTQKNLKRILAYSSIAQAGYILLGVAAMVNRDESLNERGLQATMFYIFTYVFFNAGAFAVVGLLQKKGTIGDEIDDLNGLARRSPVAAILLLVFLMSLAGIPPTAGFVAKLLILWSLVESGHPHLAFAAALCILPAAYYYFRLVAAMWVRDPFEEAAPAISAVQKFALAAMVLVTLAAGIFPEQFLHFARYSVLGPLGL
jgi:NADH-quinone oxidoreductase subunit N